MKQLIKHFAQQDSGAVTVDWVVLTAAVVGLATVAYIQVNASTMTLAESAGNAIPAAVK